MSEPSQELREAAKLMRERAEAGTPGPWERPLDTRHKNFVMAALPEGEQGSHTDGMIPAEFSSHKGPTGRYAGQRERVGIVSAAIWSIGGFVRKRSGRDLDYIASMHPTVTLAIAKLLEARAAEYDGYASGPYGEAGAAFVAGDAGGDIDPAVAVARAYLGSES
jgi:hypothetical protein